MKRDHSFSFDDTIASIATMPGQAAVGVIKVSGKKALAIIGEIFRAKRKKDLKEDVHPALRVDRRQTEDGRRKTDDEQWGDRRGAGGGYEGPLLLYP